MSYQQQPYSFGQSPYSPPNVDYRQWGAVQPNSMGRVAAIWQLILGAFFFLSGACIGTAVWALPDDVMNQAIEQQQSALPPMGNMSPLEEIRVLTSIGSGMMLLAGLLLLIFVYFVYRGGKISAICSMVVCGLIGLIMLLNVVSGLAQVAAKPMTALPVFIMLGILALTVVTFIRLVMAVRSSGAAQAQAMQQAYYWMMQYQQQYAAQNRAGYGYGQAMPAPPPSSPAPVQGPMVAPLQYETPPPAEDESEKSDKG